MRLLSVFPILLTLSTSACVHEQEVRKLVSFDREAEVTVFLDVQVFPATGTHALQHHDVIVRGHRIEAVRPTGEPVPSHARIVDGEGKTLLPGLVDAHFHTHVTGAPPWYLALPNPKHVLEESLYSGITTAHDMAGPMDDVLKLRAEVEAGRLIGPRLRVAGPLLTAPHGYPASYIERVLPWPISVIGLSGVVRQLPDVETAVKTVDEVADAKVDFVKIAIASTPDGTPVLSAEQVKAITDRAHARGLRVVAHIDTAENALRAAENGVDLLVHGVHSTGLTDAEAARIAQHVRGVAPTLITFERLAQLKHNQLTITEIEAETVATDIQRELFRGKDSGYTLNADLDAWLLHLDEHEGDRLSGNNLRLREAGVHILVGTDGHGSTASFPAGIHEEMRLLVAGGIPNAEVLLGATAWTAQMTTNNPSFGTIEAGKDADLLLVSGDPLTDITATSSIEMVMTRGRIVKRIRPEKP